MSMQSTGAVSARKGVVITPANDTRIETTRAVWVGGAGNLTVKFMDNTSPTTSGGTVLISGIPAGTLLPIAVNCINATSTTATLIVALY
jgi:hypothetical protein